MSAAKLTATYHAGMYQPPAGRPCWHTVRDAADAAGVSEATVRRALRQRGARVGRTVSGMVEIRAAGRVGFVPVAAHEGGAK